MDDRLEKVAPPKKSNSNNTIPDTALRTPDGEIAACDRTMLLYLWKQVLDKERDKPGITAGIGKPTYPAHPEIFTAGINYLSQHSIKSKQARDALDTLELSDNGGRFDERTYDDAIKANSALTYSHPQGIEEYRTTFADAIKKEYDGRVTADDVLFTVGGAGALYAIFKALNSQSPYGRIITTTPHYGLHGGTANVNRLHGINLFDLPGYKLTADAVKKAIEEAKQAAEYDQGSISGFIFSYPHNPTGTVLDEQTWLEIAEVIRTDKSLNNAVIVLDEAYAEMNFDSKHNSLFALAPDLRDRIVLMRSATKGFSAARERMAALVCTNSSLMTSIVAAHIDTIGHAPGVLQAAYAAAMKEYAKELQRETPSKMIEMYKGKLRNYQADIEELGIRMPDDAYTVDGTFYVMADLSDLIGMQVPQRILKDFNRALPSVTYLRSDEDICYFLLFQEGIMLAPLSYFGVDSAKGYVRITASGVEDDRMAIAHRLKNVLKERRSDVARSLRLQLQELLGQLKVKNCSQFEPFFEEINSNITRPIKLNSSGNSHNTSTSSSPSSALKIKKEIVKIREYIKRANMLLTQLDVTENSEERCTLKLQSIARSTLAKYKLKSRHSEHNKQWKDWVLANRNDSDRMRKKYLAKSIPERNQIESWTKSAQFRFFSSSESDTTNQSTAEKLAVFQIMQILDSCGIKNGGTKEVFELALKSYPIERTL